MVKVLAQLRVVQQVGVALTQVFVRHDEKARRTAGRVADDVGGRGRREFHHQPDDVARGAELAVLPGGGDLGEHVFVDVALGVAVFHRHVVEQVHHLGQQCRRRNGEARALHVVRVGGVAIAELAGEPLTQVRKDVLAHDGVHLRRGEVLEARPAEVFIESAFRVAARGKDAPLHRPLEAVGFVFLQRVQVVEPAQEEEIGDLLDHLQRIRDAARPEGVPDAIDLVLDVAGDHALGLTPSQESTPVLRVRRF